MSLKHKLAFLILLAVFMVINTGCVSLSPAEKIGYPILKNAGLTEEHDNNSMPALGGILNILPGVGNFYLAAAGDETPQIAYGVVNLLFWPISVVWGIPEGIIDGAALNKRKVYTYFKFDPRGKKEWEAYKAKNPDAPDLP
ncbi:MAG: hypothetical protein JEZ07_13755 [Phycisphaerae bacterium]|nr:hypothetical protein [Phycisphaerae bacterium]